MAYPELFNAIRPKWFSFALSRLLKRAALLVVLTVLGAYLSYEITSVRQQWAERRRLLAVANRQIDRGRALGLEAKSVLAVLSVPGDSPCSADDLNVIQRAIVGSAHIWDAGRDRDGKILCSVLEGSISPPFSAGPPTATINGNQIWLYPWPLTPPRHQGFILDAGGSWVVLDQEILDHLDGVEGESTTTYLHDKKHDAFIRSIGVVPALSVAEIAASKFIERNGVLYQPLCVERSAICAVAVEQQSVFRQRVKLVLRLWTAIGGLSGACVSFSLFILDSRLRTLEWNLFLRGYQFAAMRPASRSTRIRRPGFAPTSAKSSCKSASPP